MPTSRALRSSAVVAGSLVATLVLASCSSGGSEPAESASSDDLLATVDTMFGEVEVPQPADGDLTVVALGWSDAEMALALGVQPVAVFDWQSFGAETNGVGPWASDLFTDGAPEIIERGDQSLNYEQILALEPDLILNTRSGNDEEEFTRLSEIAPTVYAPEGTGAYATSWDVQLTSVSEALGLADEGSDLIAETEDLIQQTAADNPELDGLSVVAGSKFGDAYGAYLPGDGRFDILADLGLVNAPVVEALESSGFYANVSAEQVSVFDADIVTMLPIGYTEAETEADPLLASLPAFTSGRAVVMDPDSELSGAYSASSVLSIPVTLDLLTPLLTDAAAQL